MFQDLEATGEWWLPDDPAKRIAGTSPIRPAAGAALHLFCRFVKTEDLFSYTDQPAIFGETAVGSITLLYARELGWGPTGPTSSSLTADLDDQGCPMLAPTNLAEELSVELTRLDVWSSVTGLNLQPEYENDMLRRVSVTYEAPKPFKLSIDDTLSLTFGGSYKSVQSSAQERVPSPKRSLRQRLGEPVPSRRVSTPVEF